MPRLLFRPEYVWFLVHLNVDVLLNYSVQLAELIAYIIPLDWICIVTTSY